MKLLPLLQSSSRVCELASSCIHSYEEKCSQVAGSSGIPTAGIPTAETCSQVANVVKAACGGQAEYEKERFKLPADLVQAAKGGPEPAKKKRKTGGSTASNAMSKDEDDKEKLVLWRVNRDEFNKRLR